MTDTLYTIGYSGFKIEDFLSVIRSHNISALIDVRSNPYSAHFPEFNKERLESHLYKNSIQYRNYSKEFGAQQMNRAYYSPEGFLDFERFVKSESFREGYTKLLNGMKQDFTFALMCAEKKPIDCHRAIMISRVFHEAGHNVVHLLPNDETASQNDIEEYMLDYYFPNRMQFSLFEVVDKTTLIINAYRKKNAEIGFRPEERKAI